MGARELLSRSVEDAGAWVDAEARLAELSRSRGALRRVLAGLAAAFVGRQGWETLGYVRVGDHARERLGLSGRSLHDLARVGRVLSGLPRLEAALVAGRLPWSKVRLLARFVSPVDEARWIRFARGLSVRELEHRVRAVDRGALEAAACEPLDEEGEPLETLRLRVGSRVCFQWQHTRRHAARVAGEKVSPATVLEMVTAEALSTLPAGVFVEGPRAAEPLRVRGTRSSPSPLASVCTPQGPGVEPVDGGEDEPAQIAALPAFLAPLLDGLGEADALELDARLCRAVRLEQRLDAEIAPLLRRVGPLARRARETLGMSPRKARALVRLERVGDVCPALREAFRSGSLSWLQAQLLSPLLLDHEGGGWREAWLAFARQVTLRRLEEAVERALALRDAHPEAWEVCRHDPWGAGTHEARARRQTCARPTDLIEGIPLRITAPRDVVRLFRVVLCSLRRAEEARTGRLPSESQAFGAMLGHALATWGVEKKVPRRFHVFARDGWRCTVPGCTSYRNLHAHHLRFRSVGGGDEPGNQTTLCAAHHLRHVHTGRIRIHGKAPDGLRFELPRARYRSDDRLVSSGSSSASE